MPERQRMLFLHLCLKLCSARRDIKRNDTRLRQSLMQTCMQHCHKQWAKREMRHIRWTWSTLCHQCQTARCSVWRCQCLRAWSALWLQFHRQDAALADYVSVHECEVPCATNVTNSMLLSLKTSIFMNTKRPVPSVPQTACSLCEDIDVYAHEVPCAFSVTGGTLLCVKMSMFTNMKWPVP